MFSSEGVFNLVSSLAWSRFNSLLYKLPQYQYDRLQKVLNAAAWVRCLIPKFIHITPVLRELHCLPVKFRVEFKIALLV